MSVLIKGETLQQVMRVIMHSTEWLSDDVEIVEVSEPHGRIVDIEDVKKAIFDYHGEDEQKVRTMINVILSSVPTVIEAEDDK